MREKSTVWSPDDIEPEATRGPATSDKRLSEVVQRPPSPMPVASVAYRMPSVQSTSPIDRQHLLEAVAKLLQGETAGAPSNDEPPATTTAEPETPSYEPVKPTAIDPDISLAEISALLGHMVDVSNQADWNSRTLAQASREAAIARINALYDSLTK